MKSLESKIVPVGQAGTNTTYADREIPPRRAEVSREEKTAAEKPKVSEEIAIEEISIDGMCGVY